MAKEFPGYLKKGIAEFGGVGLFATALGVSNQTLYSWSEQDPTPERRKRVKECISKHQKKAAKASAKVAPAADSAEAAAKAPKAADLPDFLQEAVAKFGSVPAFAKAFGVHPTSVYHWRTRATGDLADVKAKVRAFLADLPSDDDVDFSAPLVVSSLHFQPGSAEFLGIMEKKKTGESTGAHKHLIAIRLADGGELLHKLVDRRGFSLADKKGKSERILAAPVRDKREAREVGPGRSRSVDLTPMLDSIGGVRSDVQQVLSVNRTLVESLNSAAFRSLPGQADFAKIADAVRTMQKSVGPLESKLDRVLDRVDGFVQQVLKLDARVESLLTVRRREAAPPAAVVETSATPVQTELFPDEESEPEPDPLKEMSPQAVQTRETKYLKLLQQFNKDAEALSAMRTLMKLQAVTSVSTGHWRHQDRPSVKNPVGTFAKIEPSPSGFTARLFTNHGSVEVGFQVSPLTLVPRVAELAYQLNRDEGVAQFVRQAERDGPRPSHN